MVIIIELQQRTVENPKKKFFADFITSSAVTFPLDTFVLPYNP